MCLSYYEMCVSVHKMFIHLAGDAGCVSAQQEEFCHRIHQLRRAKGTQSWALFTCVCSSRPQFSQMVLGKALQGTERLHSTKDRTALSGIAFWWKCPEKVEVGLHQSVWSKTSWDALPPSMFGEPCLRLWVAKCLLHYWKKLLPSSVPQYLEKEDCI